MTTVSLDVLVILRVKSKAPPGSARLDGVTVFSSVTSGRMSVTSTDWSSLSEAVPPSLSSTVTVASFG